MQTSPQSVSKTPPPAAPDNPQPGPYAERTYQVLTIAFMILLLGSLWLFR